MHFLRHITPRFLISAYHYLFALLGAVIFGNPSRKLNVIAVTGTKGKSTVVELVSALLDEAGFKTAHASTIHFKIGDKKERNLHKMTMPGRFFLQSFLRKAVKAGCTHAVIEMTSEGARQFRHKFIALDALIFTNLSPEHIESHGSYGKYIAAKVSLGAALEKSPKKDKVLVVNGDDKEAEKFLTVFSGTKVVYSKKDATGEIISSEGVCRGVSTAAFSFQRRETC
jgi:UDP-N-acetylmuramoyl-L-alanyl-D-glutamate--2,6-diaminopimelate ligase